MVGCDVESLGDEIEEI